MCKNEVSFLYKFQFYDSPIKSEPNVRTACACCWFQFYDSPIKRSLHTLRSALRRLFQFYDSPIKSAAAFEADIREAYSFNSMIVRLKGRCSTVSITKRKGFNSMIVRLKAPPTRGRRRMSVVSIL